MVMAQVRSLETGRKFKDTPIGKIPVDWETLPLSHISKIIMGQSPSSKDYNDKCQGLPFYQGNTDFGPKYPIPTKWCTKPTKIALKGDILISVRAPVGEINIAPHECCIGRGIGAIRTTKANGEFLYQSMLLLRKLFERVSQGSTFEAINSKDLSDFLILSPPLPEQKKIAEILSTVDNAIEETDRVIDKTKELKQGLMQKLLTRGIGHKKFKKTELGKIPKEWKVVKVKEIGSKDKYAIVDGPFGSSVNTSVDYINQGVPVIRTVNIRPFKFIEKNLKFISEEKFQELKRSQVKPKDVLFSKVGTVGYACLFPVHIEKAILSTTGSCKISVDQSKIKPEYLCYYLNYLKPYMDRTPTILFCSLRIGLPTLKEQNKIVGVLSSVDSEIENEETKKQELESLKKSLMQVLLTGKVRVK